MRLPVGSPAGLDPGDVLRLHTLPALGRLVAHLGALLEGLEPGALYTVVVHEEVLAPVVRGDKAVALLVAEPLHCSLGHFWDLPFSTRAASIPTSRRTSEKSGKAKF